MNTINSLLVLSLASAPLPSCVVFDYPGGSDSSGLTSLSFGIYDTLPATYTGDAYFYQNRYYYGGNHQHGIFSYKGRQYNERYYHGGKYYYGGRLEHHENRHPQRPGNQEHHPDDHGRGAASNRDQQ